MYFNNKTILCLDGQFLEAQHAHAGLYDQTLHYGYGVFEGLRSYETGSGTRIFKAKEHFARLSRSCELMNIPFSYTPEVLEDWSMQVLKKNKFKDAYIRPLVYCGPNMSLTRPSDVHMMICAWEWGAYLGEKTLNLLISSFCRPHPRSTKVEAKASGHYVNSILASTDAKDKGYDEALLLDHEGYLAEGPGANLFFGVGKVLYTPAPGCILPGITRATVIELCTRLGLKVVEGKYRPEKLMEAEYAFYCGTAAELIGIDSVDGKRLNGHWMDSPGKMLQEAYRREVHGEAVSSLKIKA
jgi:branched-chain amino acid aminotransferase